jgi:Phosphoenolpyruvate synthase/pyruvate phosphate dikinase
VVCINNYLLFFNEIDKTQLPWVGGKGANLGEMVRAGLPVPTGFCITTEAYSAFIQTSSQMESLFARLERLMPDQPAQISELGLTIRSHLESVAIPEEIQASIIEGWQKLGAEYAYAVRSSATAEDLPGASFAGQQESYLNVKGAQQMLDSVRKCWASLFTDRAIAYRMQNGFDHRSVHLAVVVQHMVLPEVSGIMFTADPVSGNRKIVSIDAGYGLGEAMVSGIITADLYQVRADKLIRKEIACKEIAINARAEGGTDKVNINEEMQRIACLSDHQAIRLAKMGRSIEDYFGSPQDIEWGLVQNEIFILQSRPITTLYPVPPVTDNRLHLFLSFGHVQMMTEAIKPLGISVLRTLMPAGKSSASAESDILREAGGRLYVDLTKVLEYKQARQRVPEILANVDEFMGKTVKEFSQRDDFLTSINPDMNLDLAVINKLMPTALNVLKNILYRNHEHVIDSINAYSADQVKKNREKLQTAAGTARIEQIQEILSPMLSNLLLKIAPYFGAAFLTYMLISRFSQRWLGDKAELGSISKSPPGNVTTEMGLALGDLADEVRTHREVIEYLEEADNETFLDGFKNVKGGDDILPAFVTFLERYGMRGTGEIDVTRPRWREAPTQLVPAILGHIKGVSPARHRLDFLAGKEEAEHAAERLLDRLRHTSGGYFKARQMARLITVHRALIGLREHPKYLIVQNFDNIKQAILEEAAQLAAAGLLERPEDIFWFSLEEIKEIIAAKYINPEIITIRREKYKQDEKLIPPRAFSSEGEIILVKADADVPPGALAGSPVSSGVAEGRARVILKLENARMEKGDILVAPYTDPAWTTLFPLAAGLVTEVGGLMTHGAVVAREYGIPAVVGVDNATGKIEDGRRIRVDGNRGYVKLL